MTQPVITAFALPGMLAEVASVTSPEIAVTIARRYGGRRLYIPQLVTAAHPLARLVGLRAARAIAAHFPSDTYDVPSARTLLRWHDARKLADQGLSRDAIGGRLGINRKRVGMLLEGYRAAGDAKPPSERRCLMCGRPAGVSGRVSIAGSPPPSSGDAG